MDLLAILAGLGGAVVAGLAFFFVGNSIGEKRALRRQADAKATAEELSKRIVADAEQEVRARRKEVEADERRATEKESVLDRKVEMIEQRDKELSKRASDFGRREKTLGDREEELD